MEGDTSLAVLPIDAVVIKIWLFTFHVPAEWCSGILRVQRQARRLLCLSIIFGSVPAVLGSRAIGILSALLVRCSLFGALVRVRPSVTSFAEECRTTILVVVAVLSAFETLASALVTVH